MAALKLSKSDLINTLTADEELSGLTKKEIKMVVDKVFLILGAVIVAGGVATIQGFGRLFTRVAKAKSFKKIISGEIVEVGERNLPKMKFSKSLVNRVKGLI